MKHKVNYIRWQRDDAIKKVSDNLILKLKNKINLNIILLNRPVKNKVLSLYRISKNFITLIKLYFKKEIIHLEEPENIESNLFLLLRRKRLILTEHHIYERKTKLGLYNLVSMLKDKSFSKLIAISENTKKDLIEKYNIDPEKINVAYLGVDHKIFKTANRKVDSLKDKNYIFYLGSEIPRKNIENLLKAFKLISEKYPKLYLVKAGYSGGDKYRKNTLRLIKELNITNKVIIVSKRLREKDLPIYYSNAELFVFPTLQEGFGMPLVEAMACGCPVVTSNIAPMNEIAKGQVLVNPYNYKDIAKGVDKILSNKKYKDELIKKAIIRAKDFDWEKFSNNILNIYQHIDKSLSKN